MNDVVKFGYYQRTYGMSFYRYVCMCEPVSAPWYKDAMEKITSGDVPEWFFTTEAKEIVGNQAVAKLVKEAGLC